MADADELRAMAAAMRKEHDRFCNERGWNVDAYWAAMARAAKEAQRKDVQRAHDVSESADTKDVLDLEIDE